MATKPKISAEASPEATPVIVPPAPTPKAPELIVGIKRGVALAAPSKNPPIISTTADGVTVKRWT